MKPSEIDGAVQNLCVHIRQYTFIDINNRLVDKLRKLHATWMEKGDIFALLEANYLVDFYCSHITNFCDANNKYNAVSTDPAAHHKATRRFSWEGGIETYDVFREYKTYADGFLAVKGFMLQLRKDFMKELVALAPDQVIQHVSNTAYHVELDWEAMLKRYPLQQYVDAASRVINARTTYYAAGWGVYRLVNLNNYQDKLPASCIVNSLMLLSLLYMTGFPPQHIASYYQIPKNTKSKQYTHWASACVNPFSRGAKSNVGKFGVISTMDTTSMMSFWSTGAFTSFTHDIIRYFKTSSTSFVYAPGAVDGPTRDMVLSDFAWKIKNTIV